MGKFVLYKNEQKIYKLECDLPEQENEFYVVFEMPVDDPDELIYDGSQIRLKTEEEKRNELLPLVRQHILNSHKAWLNSFLQTHGYHSLGDLLYYATVLNDQEATELLEIYRLKEQEVWALIDDLPNKTYNELKELLNARETG